MDATPEKAVGYIRVSTDDQAEHGLSMGDQSETIRAYCRAAKLDLVAIVEDPGESSKSLERQGIRRVLAMLDAGQVDHLVVAHLDRLTRHVGDAVHLVEVYFAGPPRRLHCCSMPMDTRTVYGRFILYLMALLGQFQRESIADRTESTMAAKRERGERLGTIPYGWRLGEDGKALVSDPDEQHVLSMMHHLRDFEDLTFRAIAAKLDELGHATRSGKPWSASSINAILRRAG